MPPKAKKRPGEDSEDSQDLSKMKVSELREELEKRGLDASGKKAELVARLEEALKGEHYSKQASKKKKKKSS